VFRRKAPGKELDAVSTAIPGGEAARNGLLTAGVERAAEHRSSAAAMLTSYCFGFQASASACASFICAFVIRFTKVALCPGGSSRIHLHKGTVEQLRAAS